jgi:outer membrane protein assembly factor BamB
MKRKILHIIIALNLITIFLFTPSIVALNNLENNVIKNFRIIESNTNNETDWWPMIHHDYFHTGFSSSNGPKTNNILWKFNTYGYIRSSPVIVDNKVYFVSNGIDNENYKIFCLDTIFGQKIWENEIELGLYSSPTIYENNLYLCCNGLVYCFNANDGQIIWTKETRAFSSTPIIINNDLFVGTGNLYCLNAQTGDIKWEKNIGNVISSATPAFYNNKLYVCSDKLYCINPNDGNILWSYSTSQDVVCSPLVYDNKVIITTGYLYDTELICVDSNNGNLVWKISYGENVQTDQSPSLFLNKIYFGSYVYDDGDFYGSIYCIDADNGLNDWELQLEYPITSEIAIADGKLYFGVGGAWIYCIDAENSSIIWMQKMNAIASYSPSIADNKLFVPSIDDNLYCIRDQSAPDNPEINGKNKGEYGVSYSYIINISDVDFDDLYLYIDWGDDSNSGWLGPFTSGMSIEVNHTWANSGIYSMKAKTKDIYDSQSDWTIFEVSMPRYKSIFNYLQRFPLIYQLFNRYLLL